MQARILRSSINVWASARSRWLSSSRLGDAALAAGLRAELEVLRTARAGAPAADTIHDASARGALAAGAGSVEEYGSAVDALLGRKGSGAGPAAFQAALAASQVMQARKALSAPAMAASKPVAGSQQPPGARPSRADAEAALQRMVEHIQASQGAGAGATAALGELMSRPGSAHPGPRAVRPRVEVSEATLVRVVLRCARAQASLLLGEAELLRGSGAGPASLQPALMEVMPMAAELVFDEEGVEEGEVDDAMEAMASRPAVAAADGESSRVLRAAIAAATDVLGGADRQEAAARHGLRSLDLEEVLG